MNIPECSLEGSVEACMYGAMNIIDEVLRRLTYE
jgi:hypothetical protein